MSPQFSKILTSIWHEAIPYLKNCRPGDLIHTRISVGIMEEILQAEGGEKQILLPTIILHDIGWSGSYASLVNFFDDIGISDRDEARRREHMEKGSLLAREILNKVGWEPQKIEVITSIISKHDLPDQMTSELEKKVFDADYAWRFTQAGMYLDIERFKISFDEAINRLEESKDNLKTLTGRRIAHRELTLRKQDFCVDYLPFS